jgi:hypothetical protein
MTECAARSVQHLTQWPFDVHLSPEANVGAPVPAALPAIGSFVDRMK